LRITSRVTVHALLTIGLLSIAACPGNEATRFEGTWTYNAGSSLTITCPDGTDTANITGNEDFRPGTDSDLVVISSTGCNIKVNASGNHADAIPGQSCSTLLNGVTTTITFNTGTYVFQSEVLSFSAAGTVGVMGPGGEVTCTVAASATLHKVSG
jgi:hypothetical protein